MFELRNENQVWYKTEEMYDWIHYGNTPIVEPDMIENTFNIKKFDFDKEEYIIDTSITEYEYNDIVYTVIDGQFVVESEFEPLPDLEPTQLDRIEAALNSSQQEMIDREIDRYTLDLIEQGLL